MKENEVVEPIRKEVKRPFMKAMSIILIPLSIFLILVVICTYFAFYTDVDDYASLTPDEWKENSKGFTTSIGTYIGCSSYEEFKNEVWEQLGYSKIPIFPIIVIAIASGSFGIIARISYKESQKEE